MRDVLISLLLLTFLVGCQTKSKVIVKEEPKEAEKMEKYSEELYVPLDVVKKIPGKLNNLKFGMSRDEAIAALGLSSYPIVNFVSGSGPLANHQSSYFLRPGYILILIFDRTDKSGIEKFKKAILSGENWENK